MIGTPKIFILGESDSGKSTLAASLSEALADHKGSLPVYSAGAWVREHIENDENFAANAYEFTMRCLRKNPHHSANLIDNFILKNINRPKIIEGIRNPIDLYASFNTQRDIFIILESCNSSPSTKFERAGLNACAEYISFLFEVGLISSERFIPLKKKDYDLEELILQLKEIMS